MKILIACLMIVCLSACATHPSSDAEALSNLNLDLAMAYLKQGSPVMAKQHFLLALQEAPDNPAVLAGYGLYLEKVGDPLAESYYQKAVELNPHSAMAHNNDGTYLCRHGQYAQGIREFQEAIDQPDYLYTAETYENMGICSELANQLVAAKAYFTKALDYDPSLSFSRERLKKLES